MKNHQKNATRTTRVLALCRMPLIMTAKVVAATAPITLERWPWWAKITTDWTQIVTGSVASHRRYLPSSSEMIRRTIGMACAMVLALATPALADSASMTTRDAGGGQIEVNVSVTSTSCSPYEFCGWFAYAVERHSSLACSADETFLRWVGTFHENAGTETNTFLFRPFFPRATKLCVVLQNAAGVNVVGEAAITLPSGYGVQRSSGYNCSDFGSQSAAQYYLYLYPGDPSNLDGEGDGAACESNKCPCGAERIPPEPEPVIPSVVLPPSKTRPFLPFISTNAFRCNHLSVSAGREGWALFAADDQPFPSQIELKLRGPALRPAKYVAVGSKRKVSWGWLPAARYKLSIRYPGDESHLPSRTKILRPFVHRCRY